MQLTNFAFSFRKKLTRLQQTDVKMYGIWEFCKAKKKKHQRNKQKNTRILAFNATVVFLIYKNYAMQHYFSTQHN